MSKNDTPSIDDLLRQGSAALDEDDLEVARDCARRVLRLRPNHPFGSNLLGLAMLGQGQHTEAREVFEALLLRNPDVVTLCVNAGLAALASGELGAALEHIRRAVERDDAHGRAFGYLAFVHLCLGEIGFARAALREAGLSALAEKLPAVEDGAPGDVSDAALQELDREVRSLDNGGASPAAHEGFAEAAGLPSEALARHQSASSQDSRSTVEISDALDSLFGETGQQSRFAPAGKTPAGRFAPAGETPAGPFDATRRAAPRSGAPTATCPDSVAIGLPEGAGVGLQEPMLLLDLAEGEARSAVVLRRDQLVLSQGDFRWSEVTRRRKGKAEGPFQLEDGACLERVEGAGTLAMLPDEGRRYVLFHLKQSGIYLRERDVAAFADRLHHESGGIPRAGSDSPRIVTLRGIGFVVAAARGPLFSRAVDRAHPLTVNLDHVLAWCPNVVPAPVEQPDVSGQPVCFSGTGTVWLDLPRR